MQQGLEDNLVSYQGSVFLSRKLGRALGHEKASLEKPGSGYFNFSLKNAIVLCHASSAAALSYLGVESL